MKTVEKTRVELVARSIGRCKQKIRTVLQPMLQVPLVSSLLHSIVAHCTENHKDPVKHLSSGELLEQIAHIQKLQKSAQGMLDLETVRISRLRDLGRLD